MPSFPCQHPTCTEILPAKGYCAAHAAQGKAATSRHSYYDRHLRNTEAKAFYNSAAWLITRAQKLTLQPICEKCGFAWAEHVHHKVAVLADKEKRLDPANLMSVCAACHNAIEAQVRKES